MAFTPVSLKSHVNDNAQSVWENESSLDGATYATVAHIHPLFNRLAILVDRQGLFNVQGFFFFVKSAECIPT